MKKEVIQNTFCDLCGRGYQVEQDRVGSYGYLVIDAKKDIVVQVDFCPICTKQMYGQVKRIRRSKRELDLNAEKKQHSRNASAS